MPLLVASWKMTLSLYFHAVDERLRLAELRLKAFLSDTVKLRLLLHGWRWSVCGQLC